ncbi:hypothetical protein V5O48_014726 [Marasmius crinis-equi]|uniref:Uncharacterized protein n=1 Tax=Marasmius crinis-equi TaxID=585013 RepID=A0ABR3EWG9_9AGAR
MSDVPRSRSYSASPLLQGAPSIPSRSTTPFHPGSSCIPSTQSLPAFTHGSESYPLLDSNYRRDCSSLPDVPSGRQSGTKSSEPLDTTLRDIQMEDGSGVDDGDSDGDGEEEKGLETYEMRSDEDDDMVNDAGIPVAMPSLGNAEHLLKTKSLAKKPLNVSIVKALKQREKQVEKLVKSNGVRRPRVNKLMGTISAINRKKRPSIWNAAMKPKAAEVNTGKEKGEKVSISELHRLVREDTVLQESMKDDKKSKEMVEDAMAAREDKMMGVRGSNRVAARDASNILERFTSEANNLHERSGVLSFGIICRGSFKSSAEAGYFGRGPVADFMKMHFNMSIWDFVALFESYALGTKSLNADQTKTALSKLIQDELKSIMGHSNGMNYVQYHRQIRHKLHVQIVGWPSHIPMRAPHNLDAASARELYDLWKSEVCHWQKMTKREQLDLRRRIEEEDAAGNGPPKRKTMKDVGGTHKKPAQGRSKGSGAGKGRKKASAETVEDSDDGSTLPA